jgi:regulatory protein
VSAYSDALRLLARRELSSSQIHRRLLDRNYTPQETDAAITQLTETGALDDRRVARAYARTAATVKGRGRLRIARELHDMGITRDIAADALDEAFADLDEAALANRLLQKKLRGGTITNRQHRARLYGFLTRQGFAADVTSAALRRIDAGGDDE